MTAIAGSASLEDLIGGIAPLDAAAMRAATDRLDRLTKPQGSLGRLEALAVRLAGIRGAVTTIDRPAIVVFAADHGIAARGVSAYPSDVTRQMVANYAAGGAAINVFAAAAGCDLLVVDVGIAGPPVAVAAPQGVGGAGRAARVIGNRVRSGTRDFSVEPALTRDETLAAVDVGRRVVDDLVAGGADLIGVGEMGIGNTTASSAIVAALTGRGAASVTGAGAGLDAAGIERKIAVIDAAIARHVPDRRDPLEVLSSLGGLEIAALVGAMLAAASARVPLVLDGFITGSAALVASRLAPPIVPRLIAAHRSIEPGHGVVLDELGLDALLDLGLRLGEASGAALVIPLVRAAAGILVEMATFDEAGVSERA